jgi:HK97 family phage prohead protease
MSLTRSAFAATVTKVGDRQVKAVVSTSQKARDGHVLVPAGAKLDNFKKNPIILWNHLPEEPIGRATSIGVSDGKLVASIEFAPAGVSSVADKICGLVKAGVVSALSIGFVPIDGDPLDPGRPRSGMRITSFEILELSFCSVPVDTGAMVTERARRAGKVLSGANAKTLRDAHDAAEQCRGLLQDVLEGADEFNDSDDVDSSRAKTSFAIRQRHLEALSLRWPTLDPATRKRQAQALALRWPPDAGGLSFRRRQSDLARLERPYV